jgi:8-oxo-dGTP diphosphatase
MATHFIVGCGAVARNNEGKFLMVRQMGGYWRGQWIFPGGKLELGETLEHCARREFIEETGCDLTIKKEIGAYVSYDPDTDFEKQVVLVYFLGNSLSGTPTVGEGVTDIAWFGMKDIEEMAKKGQAPGLILKVASDSAQ